MDLRNSILLIILLGLCNLTKSQESNFKIVGEEKKPGYYWDKKGIKHQGNLELQFSTVYGKGTTVRFYQNGKKQARLGNKEMESFIYGKDSFALVHNIQLNDETIYDTDFAQVLETGTINLYQHWHKKLRYYGASGPPKIILETIYLVKLKANDFIVIQHRGNFEASFLPLIEGDEKLTKYVLGMSKTDWIDNLPSFVLEYNSRH